MALRKLKVGSHEAASIADGGLFRVRKTRGAWAFTDDVLVVVEGKRRSGSSKYLS